MGNSNKRAKQALIDIYGEFCMFEKARIAERIEQMGGIRTYRSYVAEKKFKGKKISKQLTYHHLKHRSEGGPANIENGAVVAEIAHAYLYSLPRHQEEIINDMLRRFKINALEVNTQGIGNHESIEIDMSNYMTLPVYNNTVKQNRERTAKRQKKTENLSRAEVKRDTTRKIKEYYEREDDYDR